MVLRLLSSGVEKANKVEHGQYIINVDREGGFETKLTKLLPISTHGSPAEGPGTPNASAHSPAPSDDSAPSEADGHIMAMRKDSSDIFEEVSLKASRSVLSGKLLQVLEKRKAQEADSKAKLEMEHTSALQRRDKIHMEQLDLMESAHNRTVQHLEDELERLRLQFAGAMNKWEEADKVIGELKEELASEREMRNRAEQECEDLSAVLEDNLA